MNTLRAFLVEDSALLSENIAEALEELAPIKVVGTAEDEPGATAWLAANSDSCDLLIIDIQLKRGSGFGVLRAAGKLARPLARVVLTNYATGPMREHCANLGANRLFDKSTEFGVFLEYCVSLANGETGPGYLGPPEI